MFLDVEYDGKIPINYVLNTYTSGVADNVLQNGLTGLIISLFQKI